MPITKIRYRLDSPLAQHPRKATKSAACFDLTAISYEKTDHFIEYDTGICFAIPEGWEGKLYARSSISNKGMMLCNGTGVIDSDYRGTVKLRFYSQGGEPRYAIGDRIGQIQFKQLPETELEHVQDLSQTERGTGGFGSTGK